MRINTNPNGKQKSRECGMKNGIEFLSASHQSTFLPESIEMRTDHRRVKEIET